MATYRLFESKYPANTWNWNKMNREKKAYWIKDNDLASFVAPLWKNDMNFSNVLDLGTGLGGAARVFAKHEFNVSALDIDKVAVKIATSYSDGLNIEYQVGDMLNLPYPNERFQCVFADNVLGLTYTQGLYRAIDEIHRVLVYGGNVMFTIGSKELEKFKNGNQIDSNTIVEKVKYGSYKSTFCFIDNKMIPFLLNGFYILIKNLKNDGYLILAQKHKERQRVNGY